MIAVLSPAKTLDYSQGHLQAIQSPTLKKDTNELIDVLKKKSRKDLMKLMNIKEKLADLNFQRYQSFSPRYTKNNSKAAVLAFKGDVYLGLQADLFKKNHIDYAQDHLRILSGLYGILKPLDKMQPYRLEMGTSLKTQKGKNLYQFWDDKITKELNKTIKNSKSKYLVNLASNEYFKSIDKAKLNVPVIDVAFKEYRDGKLKFISFNAKKARGLMAKYMIENKVSSITKLKAFNLDGYYYEESLSKDGLLTFVR